jgi:hypothetical protein
MPHSFSGGFCDIFIRMGLFYSSAGDSYLHFQRTSIFILGELKGSQHPFSGIPVLTLRGSDIHSHKFFFDSFSGVLHPVADFSILGKFLKSFTVVPSFIQGYCILHPFAGGSYIHSPRALTFIIMRFLYS